ncbi:MAG TPA: carboxypeptidase-like regulatory domain-containing protein, partial [Thermoanaerobaculia bacterium]|nr:carboxypeptidase-like regulatory domain-containing protein [Thermoanaerobaculia bacterium]
MTSNAHKAFPFLAVLLMLSFGGDVSAQPPAAHPPGVAGRVLGETSPLAAAGVYAFQLADLKLHKVTTDPQGNFLFQDLPAGLYKVIAHKTGFAPVVILLTRTTAQAYQFLDLQLTQEAVQKTGAPAAARGDDFWALRASIPPDVLRDIEQTREEDLPRFANATNADRGAISLGALSQFHTDIQAMKGVDNLTAAGAGQIEGGRLGIEGRLGDMQVGLRGRFWQFDPTPSFGASPASSPASGQTSAVSLDLENGPRSRLNVSTLTNRQITRSGDTPTPVDFSHYRVSWSQAVGDNSRSEIAAQYTSESNFNRQGVNDPVEIPGASRTWRVDGSYTTELSPNSTFQGGIRYRALQYDLSSPGGQQPGLVTPGQDSLDVFGRGGIRLQPAVLVEYGLYNTLADG